MQIIRRMKLQYTFWKVVNKSCLRKLYSLQLDEKVIKGQIKELVLDSVEEMLNELLEAERLIQSVRYERNEQSQGY